MGDTPDNTIGQNQKAPDRNILGTQEKATEVQKKSGKPSATGRRHGLSTQQIEAILEKSIPTVFKEQMGTQVDQLGHIDLGGTLSILAADAFFQTRLAADADFRSKPESKIFITGDPYNVDATAEVSTLAAIHQGLEYRRYNENIELVWRFLGVGERDKVSCTVRDNGRESTSIISAVTKEGQTRTITHTYDANGDGQVCLALEEQVGVGQPPAVREVRFAAPVLDDPITALTDTRKRVLATQQDLGTEISFGVRYTHVKGEEPKASTVTNGRYIRIDHSPFRSDVGNPDASIQQLFSTPLRGPVRR